MHRYLKERSISSPIIAQHTARDFDVLFVNDHVKLSTDNYYAMPIKTAEASWLSTRASLSYSAGALQRHALLLCTRCTHKATSERRKACHNGPKGGGAVRRDCLYQMRANACAPCAVKRINTVFGCACRSGNIVLGVLVGLT